jgi:ribulose-phosphate 3-epimerase
MGAIVPAILPTSREDLDDKLARLAGVTDEVQIDIVDGRFVTPPSWPYKNLKEGEKSSLSDDDDLSELGSFRFDIDLMVEEPEEVIGRWVRAGATRVTVHAETTQNLAKLVSEFQVEYGHDKGFAPELLSFGLAINLATPTSLIEPYLSHCDYVQFMGIASIGKQGEPFSMSVIPKIHAFHRKYPEMPIQVDGGVSRESAVKLLEAGATRLVVGSALLRAPDLAEEMNAFNMIVATRGLYS